MTAEADTHVQNLKQHGYVVFQLMTPNDVQAAKQHVESKRSNSIRFEASLDICPNLFRGQVL